MAEALARLESEIGGPDRRMILRVDRMELSKNLLRGFWAYEELLATEPAWRERVVFVALAYPSRQGLAEYLAYQNEVESTVARINERWGAPGWAPIVLHVEDDYPRSLAALTRYDVLLVNPIRDGMNLVAKEGPVVNDSDGVLALSREAGAFEELAGPRSRSTPSTWAARPPSWPGPWHAGRWAGGRGQVTPGSGHGQEPDRLARRSARAGRPHRLNRSA